MPKPIAEENAGIGPFWKIRIALPGSIIHIASSTQPSVQLDNGRVANLACNPITDTEHGDTIGFIDWHHVIAVTWRKA